MAKKNDNDNNELEERVFKSDCLVKGKPHQRGEIADFDEVIIRDLDACNRLCKTEAEGERAKKSLAEAKKAEAAKEKEDSKTS